MGITGYRGLQRQGPNDPNMRSLVLSKITKDPVLAKELLDKELAERSLVEFFQQSWEIIEPGTKYKHNWHVDLICEYLEMVTAGEIRRLIINIPPKYLKSRIVSVVWPVWSWMKAPHERWIFASHALPLSIRDSRYRRQILMAPWYQRKWGHIVRLSEEQNQKTEFENETKGSMVCRSVKGGVIGRGGDKIVVDDPLEPEAALSETKRKEANRWIDESLSTRLDDKKTGSIVLIMQRLHEHDVTGHLLEKKTGKGEMRWVHLKLPAEAEGRTVVHFPKSGREIVRKDGDPLFPDRESKETLDELKNSDLGSYAYAGQYQQRPAPAGGGIIKKEWWRFYTEAPNSFDYMLMSWDMSFKYTTTGSYVVGQVWGKVGSKRYLLDQVRGRWSFSKTIQMIKFMTNKWPDVVAKLVEDAANGPAVISTLGDEVPGMIPVSTKNSSKTARLYAVQPYVEAGNVYLPHKTIAPWIESFMLEIERLPNTINDDQADAFTQANIYMPREFSDSDGDKAEVIETMSTADQFGSMGPSGMNPW